MIMSVLSASHWELCTHCFILERFVQSAQTSNPVTITSPAAIKPDPIAASH